MIGLGKSFFEIKADDPLAADHPTYGAFVEGYTNEKLAPDQMEEEEEAGKKLWFPIMTVILFILSICLLRIELLILSVIALIKIVWDFATKEKVQVTYARFFIYERGFVKQYWKDDDKDISTYGYDYDSIKGFTVITCKYRDNESNYLYTEVAANMETQSGGRGRIAYGRYENEKNLEDHHGFEYYASCAIHKKWYDHTIKTIYERLEKEGCLVFSDEHHEITVTKDNIRIGEQTIPTPLRHNLSEDGKKLYIYHKYEVPGIFGTDRYSTIYFYDMCDLEIFKDVFIKLYGIYLPY